MGEDETIKEILEYLKETLNDNHGYCCISTIKGRSSVNSGRSIKIKIEWDPGSLDGAMKTAFPEVEEAFEWLEKRLRQDPTGRLAVARVRLNHDVMKEKAEMNKEAEK